MVIYNNAAGPLNGTLGAPGFSIPVVGTTQAIGVENAALVGGGLTFHLATSTESETRETFNVIADTPAGDPDNVVVVGAHLDSRIEGPGINDNGSGSATILEIAEVFAAQDRDARNKLRFMWYGAEELNLLGSDVLRQRPRRGRARPDHGDGQFRHGRLAELRPVRLRR